MNRSNLLYPSNYDGVSIRSEIHNVLHGVPGEPARQRIGLYRRVRLDENNRAVTCPQCRKIGTQDHALAHICDYCLGVGYIWDEEWILYYVQPASSMGRSKAGYKEYLSQGVVETNLVVVYLEAYVKPKVLDKLIEIALNDDGTIADPLTRKFMYDIRNVDEYRLDNGKLEYYRMVCGKVTSGYIGQPITEMKAGARRFP